MKAFCFVLMPVGVREAGSGRSIDFEAVYAKLVRPAIEQAGLEPLRADGERGGAGGSSVFEQMHLCDCAVADLTTAGADDLYELGVRHAERPNTTVLVRAGGEPPVLAEARARGLAYTLTKAGRPAQAPGFVAELTDQLRLAMRPGADTPIQRFLRDWPELPHSKTDVFRDRVAYDEAIKARLARARADEHPVAALRAVEASIGDPARVEAGVLVDLLLSYRAASAWSDMIALVERLPPLLAGQVLVREQYGFALNRAGRRRQAEKVLTRLIAERGASPETCGILGRVYKDRYRAALAAGATAEATGLRNEAIGTYLSGFEADWRDAYPGINAVQLIHEADPDDPRAAELIPVVRYAVQRKIASGGADYWDHATLVELAVLAGDQRAARAALADALATAPEGWMTATTADTVCTIAARGGPRWVAGIERRLRAP